MSVRYPLTILRDIIVKIRSSPELLQQYRNCATTVKLKEANPPLDVATRWNSTYNMVRHALAYKKVISSMVVTENWKELTMIEEDWADLEAIESNNVRHN
jgi:nicotinamide mononucleotide adenylyltransferase